MCDGILDIFVLYYIYILEPHTDIDECVTTSPCAQNCTNTIGLFTCSCDDGFMLDQDKMNCLGNLCQLNIIIKMGHIWFYYYIDVNECDSMPCEANQICNNTVGSFMCLCLPGFILTEDGMCVAGNRTLRYIIICTVYYVLLLA